MADSWELYYWPLVGRGEFVRLIFEEAGVAYKEHNDFPSIKAKIHEGGLGGFPAMFPPVIVKGDFHLSQTPVICKYLGKKYGLYPDKEEDEWHAEQLNGSIHDFIAEGCQSFHGIDPIGSYSSQKEETKPYIARFVKDRLSRFLGHFESALLTNNHGNGFLFGDKLTYVDLALLHALRATESQFPEAWAAMEGIPTLRAYKDRLSARPKLDAYFKSDKCRKFEGDSMM